MRGKWLTVFVVFTVFAVSCGPKLLAPKYRSMTTDGIPIDIGSLVGGCGSVGIPTAPKQADIDATKPFLTDPQWQTLNIMFKYFPDILLDGIHTVSGKFKLPSGKTVQGGTCPILVYAPQSNAHAAGTLSNEDWSYFCFLFWGAKLHQDLNGKASACKAALVAAGLPLP